MDTVRASLALLKDALASLRSSGSRGSHDQHGSDEGVTWSYSEYHECDVLMGSVTSQTARTLHPSYTSDDLAFDAGIQIHDIELSDVHDGIPDQQLRYTTTARIPSVPGMSEEDLPDQVLAELAVRQGYADVYRVPYPTHVCQMPVITTAHLLKAARGRRIDSKHLAMVRYLHENVQPTPPQSALPPGCLWM